MKIPYIPALLLCCLLASTPCRAELSAGARQTLHTAQQLIDAKKYGQAADMLQKFVNTQGKAEAQVWLSLGGALYKSGKKGPAAQAYAKGYAQHPGNKDLCLNAGITLYETKQYAQAATFLEKAYALQKPRKAELLFQAGSAFYQGKKYADAARVLQKLLAAQRTPNKDWIRLTIHALLNAGQNTRAESLILQYLNLSPGESSYWQLLARLHLNRGKYAQSAAALEICYRLKTPTRSELEKLASLYSYQRAPLLAAATLQRAYGRTPGPDKALKVAALFAAAGRTGQAVQYLDLHAVTNQAGLQKGKLLYQARRFEEAQIVFEQLLAAQNLPEARFYLALCAWERADWNRARQELQRVAGLKPFKNQISGYLSVLTDLELARREAAQ